MGNIAAIVVQTDLDPAILEPLTQALHNAGFQPVTTAPKLPESLSEPHLFLLDEYIAGEDVSTLLPDQEGRNLAVVLLASSPYLERITAWMMPKRPGTNYRSADAFIIKGPPDDMNHIDIPIWTTALPRLIETGLRTIYRSMREYEEYKEEVRRSGTSP